MDVFTSISIIIIGSYTIDVKRTRALIREARDYKFLQVTDLKTSFETRVLISNYLQGFHKFSGATSRILLNRRKHVKIEVAAELWATVSSDGRFRTG